MTNTHENKTAKRIKKSKGYKIDFVNQQIIVTRDFQRKANETRSDEYKKLKKLLKSCRISK